MLRGLICLIYLPDIGKREKQDKYLPHKVLALSPKILIASNSRWQEIHVSNPQRSSAKPLKTYFSSPFQATRM
jgi:hypothetical protein